MIVEGKTSRLGPNSLSLTVRTEINELEFNKTRNIICMGTINAPIDENRRAPVDIICVIDRSSSMAGEKIELMKKTLVFAVDQMGERDSLGVITYDAAVSTCFELMRMNQENKNKAKDLIQSIKPGSTTNLSGGLLMGLDVAAKRTQPNDVCSILLFTDGLANVGITALDTIVLATQRKLANCKSGCTVFTFGFGDDHDPNMMQSIATAGKGMYYYLSSEDHIPLSFASCIGGLQSVLAQNLKITFETPDNVKIVKLFNTNYLTDVSNKLPCNKTTLTLGDIYMEEERDILISVSVPAIKSAFTEVHSICKISLEYFNVLSTTDEQISQEFMISRPETISPNEVNQIDAHVEKQRKRLVVVDALEKGKAMAEGKNYEEAKKVLQVANELLVISGGGDLDDEYTTQLKGELKQAEEYCGSSSNYAQNRNKMFSRVSNHQYQRNTETSEEYTFYETSAKMSKKKEWISKSRK